MKERNELIAGRAVGEGDLTACGLAGSATPQGAKSIGLHTFAEFTERLTLNLADPFAREPEAFADFF